MKYSSVRNGLSTACNIRDIDPGITEVELNGWPGNNKLKIRLHKDGARKQQYDEEVQGTETQKNYSTDTATKSQKGQLRSQDSDSIPVYESETRIQTCQSQSKSLESTVDSDDSASNASSGLSTPTEGDDTGAVLWPVSVKLSTYLAKRYNGKTSNSDSQGSQPKLSAIELGCGVGLAGIACAHIVNEQSENQNDYDNFVFEQVILTDQNPKFAERNIKLNPEFSAEKLVRLRSILQSKKLIWNPLESSSNNTVDLSDSESDVSDKFDLVIASDVLYGQDIDEIRGLVATITRLLKNSNNSSKSESESLAIIGFEVRSDWTSFGEFVMICEDEFGLELKETVDLNEIHGDAMDVNQNSIENLGNESYAYVIGWKNENI